MGLGKACGKQIGGLAAVSSSLVQYDYRFSYWWTFTPSEKFENFFDTASVHMASFTIGGPASKFMRDYEHAMAIYVRSNNESKDSNSADFQREFSKLAVYQKMIYEKSPAGIAAKRKAEQEAYERSPAGIAARKQAERDAAQRRAYENSPAGQAEARRASQSRQMCEAQKQTCIAHCPAYTSSSSREVLTANVECTIKCERISCY